MRILGRSEVCRWGDEREETLSGQGDLEIITPVVRIAKSSDFAFPRTLLERRQEVLHQPQSLEAGDGDSDREPDDNGQLQRTHGLPR